MHAQSFHSFGNALLSIALFTFSIGILFPFSGNAALRDTGSPNQFRFTSEIFYVDSNSTNAVITVDFWPGDRSWSGSVDFSTSDGTAVSGADYSPTNGTLNFSGPGTPVPVINIPIQSNPSRTTNRTLKIRLANPSAIIDRPEATLVIVASGPSIAITPGTSQGADPYIQLSWPAIYSDYVLEKSPAYDLQNWTEVTSPRTFFEEKCWVNEPCVEQPAFYRLRNPAAQ